MHERGVEEQFPNGEGAVTKPGGLENGECFMRGVIKQRSGLLALVC